MYIHVITFFLSVIVLFTIDYSFIYCSIVNMLTLPSVYTCVTGGGRLSKIRPSSDKPRTEDIWQVLLSENQR